VIRKQWSLLIIVLLLSSIGCEDSVEGCLQSNASNFDVTAVTPCDDCCELPTVSLDVELGYDTLQLRFGNEYPLNDMDTVKILSFELPLSVFTFHNDGMPREVVDTIIEFQPGKRDDYLSISQSSRYEIGHTDFEVDVDSYSCVLGYDQTELESLKPYVDINVENKVVQLVRNFHNDTIDTYSQLNIILEMADSTRTIQVQDLQNVLKTITLEDNLTFRAGQDWAIDMRIDLKRVLAGVTPRLSDAEIAALIGNNLSASVTEN